MEEKDNRDPEKEPEGNSFDYEELLKLTLRRIRAIEEYREEG